MTNLNSSLKSKKTTTQSSDSKTFDSFQQLKSLHDIQKKQSTLAEIKKVAIPQNQLKNPRLIEAAKEFNISKNTIINFLKAKGFQITDDPGKKLSEAMHNLLSISFAQDKREKQKSKNIKLSKTAVANTFQKLNMATKLEVKKKPSLLPKPLSIRKQKPAQQKIENETAVITSIANLDIETKTPDGENPIIDAITSLKQIKKATITSKQKNNAKQRLHRIVMPMPSNMIITKNGVTIVEIDWNDVDFLNGGIRVKYRNEWSNKFLINNAQSSFNVIKAYYHFKGLPKLKIQISNNVIQQVLNEEVLFYCIIFLENSGLCFSKDLRQGYQLFNRCKIYTKSYYKHHLPELFLPECFNFLCKYSSDNLPIIPVPEKIMNNSQGVHIDDSFLFPLTCSGLIYWCWESREESKATYLFKTTLTNFDSRVQKIFDYLTGDTINKRETLIQSLELQKQLDLIERVYHNDFGEWKRKIAMHSDNN